MLQFGSDERLIGKALGGSQRSWVALVARHEKRIYNYCLRMTGNPHDAMDLMQEVFLSVYRHLPSFRGQAAFHTWMMRIATNKTIDFLRLRQRLEQGRVEANPEAGEDWSGPDPVGASLASGSNPALDYEHEARHRALRVVLGKLSPEQRIVVELKFFQQYTFEEIGFQLGVPVNTVKTRLYAALAKLKHRTEVQHVM